jgi:hypothetical protein
MTTMMVLGLGVLLGMQHATEADHLAAVATLVGRERSLARGLRHGMAWGLGHTLTLLLVAGGVGLLGWVISPEVAGRFEQVVGAMLVLLGASLAWRLWHAGTASQHHGAGPRVPARSLLVGMVHGLAGSAALALLVSQTLPSPSWQLSYIALFGAGSLLGMALLSALVVMSITVAARHLAGLHAVCNAVVACLSMGLGLRLLLSGRGCSPTRRCASTSTPSTTCWPTAGRARRWPRWKSSTTRPMSWPWSRRWPMAAASSFCANCGCATRTSCAC